MKTVMTGSGEHCTVMSTKYNACPKVAFILGIPGGGYPELTSI